jgi:hypothetical protein
MRDSRTIPALAESGELLLLAGDEVGLRCCKKQVEMVPHQNPRVDFPTVAVTDLPQPMEKRLAVVIGDESRLAPLPRAIT